MNKFNDIKTKDDLASFLGVPIKKLTYILYVKGTDSYYNSFSIPKKNGKDRPINASTGDLKDLQKKIADALYLFQDDFVKDKGINTKVSHGFEKKKGIITNAKMHRNKRFILNMDLDNFFDSFHFGRVRGYFQKNSNFQLSIEVATIIAQLTCFQGKLPQGAPTSPIITNLICNILDMHLVKIAKKYKVYYTRYADDLTFSNNDKHFLDKQESLLNDIKEEVERFGLALNNNKTRFLYKDSRQEVTGLIVNKKLNVKREYYKYTRSMADHLYKHGEFKIDDVEGNIKQLEGRFAYINQLDRYNNKLDKGKHNFRKLNSREKQYQKFIFYKYFFANPKPLIVTEGKTDIIYLRTAIKKYYKDYPKLIEKKDGKYEHKISFLNRTKRLEYFLGIFQDGADSMKNIANYFIDKGNINYLKYFAGKSQSEPMNPVVLVFDNEQVSKKPLKIFKEHVKLKKQITEENLSIKIENNLYLLMNPLVNKKNECEIEDLFEESVLNHIIKGKSFSREKTFDTDKFYGKVIFANYISKKYEDINFDNFKPMLDRLQNIIEDYIG